MVNSSRILTVSYGTFSCTLEGFDDPFSTMKSIAEYFRDLAADDRYFGAEPPTPDAEMLHRIAEREIQKRVEARVSDNGVVLRQSDADLPAAGLLTGAAEVEDEIDNDAIAEAAAKAAREDAERIAEEEDAAREEAERIAAEEAEAEAERLLAEEAARVEAERIAAAEEAARAEEARKAAEQEAEEAARKAAEAEAEARRKADEEEARARREAAEAIAEARRRPLEEPVEDEAADDDSDEDTSVADRISRIRAVVDNTAASEDDDYLEDEHAEDYFESEDELAGELGDILEEAIEAEAADEAEPEAEDDDAVLSALLGKVTADEDEAETAEDEEPARRPMARVIRVRRKTPPTEAVEDEAEVEVDEQAEPRESSLDADSEAALLAELAAVERESREAIERGEAEAKLSSGDDLDDEDDTSAIDEMFDEVAEDIADHPPVSESEPEDEVAAFGTETEEEDPLLGPTSDALPVEPEEEPEDRIQHTGRASKTAFDDVDLGETDRAIDRILEKTNTQLASGESSRRRNAIQHLKAAVQAKRADDTQIEEELGSMQPDTAKTDDVYREDLSRVVRPRRPEANGDATKRRLAPLVLVSEQRVDESEAGGAQAKPVRPAQPVRPRRVAGSNLAVREDEAEELNDDISNGFRAYVADLGVEGIDDSLEAAVAFVTQEVGRPWAPRSQVISMARSTSGATRDEALKSFGQLLRDGKIEKVARGQFTLTEASAYYE